MKNMIKEDIFFTLNENAIDDSLNKITNLTYSQWKALKTMEEKEKELFIYNLTNGIQ